MQIGVFFSSTVWYWWLCELCGSHGVRPYLWVLRDGEFAVGVKRRRLKVFEQAGVSPNHMIEANETGCFVSHHLDFAGDLWGGVILSVCNIHRFWKLYCMVILSEHTSAVHGEHGSSGRLLHTIASSLSLSHGGKWLPILTGLLWELT